MVAKSIWNTHPIFSRTGYYGLSSVRVCNLIRVNSLQTRRSQSTISETTSTSSLKSETTSSKSLRNDVSTKLPPHSLLPTKMLLRSFLVSTITSNPLLLSPVLKILNFLIKSKSSIFKVDKNPLLHFGLKKTFYEHFCAGENDAEVTNTIRNIKGMGFRGVILTYAKEIVVDANAKKAVTAEPNNASGEVFASSADPSITSWKDGVMQTVKLLGDGDFLALKLTGAGAGIMDTLKSRASLPSQMVEALEEICNEAIKRSVQILVDAEQQTVQAGIDKVAIDLMRKYNRNPTATVYNTYQAYLKSTGSNLLSHMEVASKEGFTLGVKLVRGAYINSEPRHLINDTKQGTDDLYNSIAQGILTQSYGQYGDGKDFKFPSTNLFLATHNKDSTVSGYQLHHDRALAGKPTVHVKYGQLLGMADEVSCTLLQMGQESTVNRKLTNTPEVYKCLSWGSLGDCLSYLLRRAVENRDAVERTKMEHSAIWAEMKRRLRASFGFR